jgi:uncharacterized protein YbjT (DUF2867 family)
MVTVAVLGATGRTGRLVVAELVRRGVPARILVRDGAVAGFGPDVQVVIGQARDPRSLQQLVSGADGVVSALGPRKGDRTLHSDVAPLLVAAMRAAGVARFVGISGAGMDVPGDAKSPRDRLISATMRRFAGSAVQDKAGEYVVWAASGLDWTLVRPPRLTDAPGGSRVEHAAHTSPRGTAIGRADLAAFVVDCVQQRAHVGEAPLVAAA